MQHCSCNVTLNGDRNHLVHLEDVTVAEIEILRAIHGQHSVIDIEPTYTANATDELERLRRKYRRRVQTSAQQPQGNIVDMIYRGPRPSVPTVLADIGLDFKGDAKGNSRKKTPSQKAGIKAPESEEAEESLME